MATTQNDTENSQAEAEDKNSGSQQEDLNSLESGEENQASAPQDKPQGVNYEQECQDLKDKHLRLYAEFENFRRRSAKESFELVATANSKLLSKLTTVLDNFNLAFDPKHKTEKLEDFEKGIRLIYSKFKEILEEEGLEEIDAVGHEFDPNLHEALMQRPDEKWEENKVIDVLQKGYKLKSKIIKHAKVIVSTGKP